MITHSFTHDDLFSKKYVVIPADVLQITCQHKNKGKEEHQQSVLHSAYISLKCSEYLERLQSSVGES